MTKDSLIGPALLPCGDDLRAAAKTLAALLEHMESAKTFTMADVQLVKDALELLDRVRPDLSPARRI